MMEDVRQNYNDYIRDPEKGNMEQEQQEQNGGKKYSIETVKVRDIRFDKDNPNNMTDQKLKQLDYSIGKFEYGGSLIVIDQNNMIADGEHRTRVLLDRGVDEVEVARYHFRNDQERRLFRQARNKVHGEHDLQRDLDELTLLMDYDPNELDKLLSFGDVELDELRQQVMEEEQEEQEQHQKLDTTTEKEEGGETDEDLESLPIPEEIKEPVTQIGDIWQLGNHFVLCGDFDDNEAVAGLIGNRKMDMIFVDPPYNLMGSSSGFTKMDDDSVIQPFFRNLLSVIKNNTKNDGHVYICCNWRTYYPLLYANRNIQLVPKNLIVWHKPNVRLGSMYSSSHEFIIFMSNELQPVHINPSISHRNVRTVYGETNVWVYAVDTNMIRGHFAQKPLVLPERAIKNSTDEGETVMDMCIGSGTTLIACEKTSRICYGIDINPKYIDITIERWEKGTGNSAVRLEDGKKYGELKEERRQ